MTHRPSSSSRVIVVPYDPRWPAEFELAAGEAAIAMGSSVNSIHHIGSTSVPGLHAKPVIDMLAMASDLAALDGRSAQMEALGYEVMGEFGIAGRRYFRRDNASGLRTHHIHAFLDASPGAIRHLAFRDFLCAHPAIAAEYGALKQRLAAAHPNDIDAYMDGKDAFIKEMEGRAVAWRARSDSVNRP